MKKLLIAIVICIFAAGTHIPGYCQEDIGESLESEIDSEADESDSETTEAEVEFEAGEPMAP